MSATTRYIEFAGLPAAGKTTTATLLQQVLHERGRTCTVAPEPAKRSPLPKKAKRSWEFNAWSLAETVAAFIEIDAVRADDFYLFDRGFVDSLVWLRWYAKHRTLDPHSQGVLEGFATLPRWFHQFDAVFVLLTTSEVAIERRGHHGQIVNEKMFLELRDCYEEIVHELTTSRPQLHIVKLQTDSLKRADVVQMVLDRLEASIGSL